VFIDTVGSSFIENVVVSPLANTASPAACMFLVALTYVFSEFSSSQLFNLTNAWFLQMVVEV